jgi:hypothetical protein
MMMMMMMMIQMSCYYFLNHYKNYDFVRVLHSSVGMTTCYGLDDAGIEFQ